MNRSESPSTALRAPSPPLGEKDGMRGYGSWEVSTISESRIGTMNQRRTGARTALSASASDLIRADMAVRAPIAGSWVGGTSKIWTRIGAMNQIGTPLPALSPQGGERVAAGRERGGSWRGDTSKIRT